MAAKNNNTNSLNTSLPGILNRDWLLMIESKITHCKGRTSSAFFYCSQAAHKHKKYLGQRSFRLNARASQKCSRTFPAQAENTASWKRALTIEIRITMEFIESHMFNCCHFYKVNMTYSVG